MRQALLRAIWLSKQKIDNTIAPIEERSPPFKSTIVDQGEVQFTKDGAVISCEGPPVPYGIPAKSAR